MSLLGEMCKCTMRHVRTRMGKMLVAFAPRVQCTFALVILPAFFLGTTQVPKIMFFLLFVLLSNDNQGSTGNTMQRITQRQYKCIDENENYFAFVF